MFPNPNDTEKLAVLFQIAAYDDDNNEGPRCPADTVFAIPASWLKVNITICKVEGSGANDSVYIAATFGSRIRRVKKITWWADHPDSVVKSKDIDDDTCGTDTLLWALSFTVKKLYATVTDNTGAAWTDSIDAVTLLPTNLWQLSDSLLEERRYAGACVVGGKIYVFGGCREKLTVTGTASPTGVKTAEVYDPVSRKWSRIATMNVARMKAAFASVNGMIYVFGGGSEGGTTAQKSTRTVYVYYP